MRKIFCPLPSKIKVAFFFFFPIDDLSKTRTKIDERELPWKFRMGDATIKVLA